MNRFLKRLVSLVPPFPGTDAEAQTNINGHHWRVVRLHELYPEALDEWPPVVHCHKCGVLADSEQSKYPCGQKPQPIPLAFLPRK